MNDVGYRPSLLHHNAARAFLALLAATILMGSTVTNANAAVTLIRFEAKWQDDGSILVVWETSSELDSAAFFLYRAEDAGGPWTDYIDFEPAAGDEFTGATYAFVDNEVRQGTTYYYRLEEVATTGISTFFGPITSTGPTLLRKVYVPLLNASAAMFEAKWQNDGSVKAYMLPMQGTYSR